MLFKSRTGENNNQPKKRVSLTKQNVRNLAAHPKALAVPNLQHSASLNPANASDCRN